MRESLAMLRQLESAAMRQMVPLYVQAITAVERNESPDAAWEEFRERFVRAYVIAALIGRVGVINSLSKPTVQYADKPGFFVASWDRAIKAFMSKVPNVRAIVNRMLPAARAKAYYVTGIEQTDALTKIQATIAQKLSGERADTSVATIREKLAVDLSHARLETVLRTNVMTALNEGAREEINDLGDAVALLRIDEIHDRRTRGAPGTDNPGKHWQMDGFMERPQHPVWMTVKLPAGFNCRGTQSVVSWGTAERLGLADAAKRVIHQDKLDRHNESRWKIINAGLYPDPGFH